MLQLELRDLTKDFGDRRAVRGISLGVQAGEFFSILGPSGCGKTTVLRLVAGYERPDAGKVILAGRDITRLEPHERNVGMVFQNYALFPLMTVGEYVAFGLRARRVDPEEVRRRVRETLEFVDLSDRAALSVPLLSGGEQQRVAVARALVTRPEVMLLDEPLSNLDVSLRLRMREEIRALQRSTGITTLYVTHDQGEALSLSDRVAVMRSGELEQVGTPAEIYPHGDPIPTAEGTIVHPEYVDLLSAPISTPLVVVRVVDQGAEFLRFIEERHLKPVSAVTIEARDDMADAVLIRTEAGGVSTIGTKAASKVLVQAAR